MCWDACQLVAPGSTGERPRARPAALAVCCEGRRGRGSLVTNRPRWRVTSTRLLLLLLVGLGAGAGAGVGAGEGVGSVRCRCRCRYRRIECMDAARTGANNAGASAGASAGGGTL